MTAFVRGLRPSRPGVHPKNHPGYWMIRMLNGESAAASVLSQQSTFATRSLAPLLPQDTRVRQVFPDPKADTTPPSAAPAACARPAKTIWYVPVPVCFAVMAPPDELAETSRGGAYPVVLVALPAHA